MTGKESKPVVSINRVGRPESGSTAVAAATASFDANWQECLKPPTRSSIFGRIGKTKDDRCQADAGQPSSGGSRACRALEGTAAVKKGTTIVFRIIFSGPRSRASIGPAVFQNAFHRLEGFVTDVMLDAFAIDGSCCGADA